VLSGTVAIDVAIASRVCTSLIGPTELILLGGTANESVPLHWGLSVLEPAMVAVLDERLLVIARRWPRLLIALLNRGAQQTRHAILQKAISQLPRVEDRLLALMWSLADRRGIVRQDGIWVHLAITHDALAQMIGARRPTVSLGLKSLSAQGLLRAEAGGWLIDRASLAEFGSSNGDKAR
jgi:CRP-like cAMP-binding protein